MTTRLPWSVLLLLLAIGTDLSAATPATTNRVRRVPPPGIDVPDSVRAELERGVAELGARIESLRASLKGNPALLDLWPDVEVFRKAVHWPLLYHEFLRSNDVALAKGLLRQGLDRADALKAGQAPWTTATGLVVRGYVSRIDASVQPYGLVVPVSFRPGAVRHRLDVWLHGRDNNLTELKFISDRQRSPGEFAPKDAFVLHPYGRFCNAFKFAGEVDVFEAMDHVRKHYPIDEDRIAVRGFSMGGAGCWHLAAHHAGQWAAAAPGAGFAETADYTRALAREPKPAWFEQKLWHLYDAADYAANLFNCPTVAYSGELDRQKQAADIMAKALGKRGIELTHIIGPKTEHRYHPESKAEIASRIDSAVERGRDPVPRTVRFTTWTLRYNQMFWITLDGLERHWERADVEAEIACNRLIRIKSANVAALTLSMPAGTCPLDNTVEPVIEINGTTIRAPRVMSDRSWTVHLRQSDGRWRISDDQNASLSAASVGTTAGTPTLSKRHGLQGPIDDAFLDRFIMVRPTGPPWNERVSSWLSLRQADAIEQWRAQFRGEVLVKNDSEISDDDIASSHLVLWGDPGSNRVLARIAGALPIQWGAERITVRDSTYPSDRHVPVLIYPNPLNPVRYVVLNTGFTFSEVGHLSNALQTPKLPDYAVLATGPESAPATAGLRVVTAGFFDERWRLKVEND